MKTGNLYVTKNLKTDAGITLKEIATPVALADYGKVYTKDDNHAYFQDGAGNEHQILLSGQDMAEMYLFANETPTIVNTMNVFHMLSLAEISPGILDGWTYEDGTRGDDITAFATYDSGASTLVTTTVEHGLSAGDFISITGTTNYNALYEVLSAPSTITFEIKKAWDTNDDATGTYDRGGTLTAGANAAGNYKVSWNVTITPQTNAHIFTGGYCVNGVACEKCRSRDKLGTASDFSSQGTNSLLADGMALAAGDKIQYIFKNVGATGNFTIRHGNINVHRI